MTPINRIPHINIVSKPHVIKYLKGIIPTNNGNHHIIKKGVFWKVILAAITPDFDQRMVDTPHDMDELKVILPPDYRNYYLNKDCVKSLIVDTEEIFWMGALSFGATYRSNHRSDKEQAMEAFRKEFDISETIYPIENMRKQLYRKGMKITRIDYNVNPTVKGFSPEDTKRIAELYIKKKASSRTIGKKFNIHHSTVIAISNKYNSLMS